MGDWATISTTKNVKKKFITGFLSYATRKNDNTLSASEYIEHLLEVEKNVNDGTSARH